MRSQKTILPLAAAIVVLAVAGSAFALKSPSLPSIAPDQLVSSVVTSLRNPTSLSGEVLTHVDLGLPDIGGFHHSVSPTEIVSGDHDVRIWMSPDGFRVDDLLSLAQRSLYISKTDAWAYDSDRFTAWHLSVPAAHQMQREAPMPTPDPLEMSRRALGSIDPTTAVSVAGTTSVAGRDAYVLRLVPRSTKTLVGRVDIAIDAARRIPLSFAIFAKGAGRPAISIGFRTISFGKVNPSVYNFTPPKGSNVKSGLFHGTDKVAMSESMPSYTSNRPLMQHAQTRRMQTFGSGWDSIVALPAPVSHHPPVSTQGRVVKNPLMMLDKLLPYSGPLFSVRLVQSSNGSEWIVAGMVPQSSLIAVASQLG
ncbi:MAG: LolA family protein [Actinomycetota bacterium]